MASVGRLAVRCRALLSKSAASSVLQSRGGITFGRFYSLGKQERGFQVLAAVRDQFLRLMKDFREEEQLAAGGPVEFEDDLQILLYPDAKLRAKNITINVFDDRLKLLVEKMLDMMYRTDGVGLSAPQVGVNARLMVFNPAGARDQGKEYVFVNPTIIKYGKKQETDTEGCLSFRSLEAAIERPISIKVEARDVNGNKFTTRFTDWIARIFQHEFDHLEGVLYVDRMSPEVLNSIAQPLLELEEEFEKKTGKPRPESIKSKLSSAIAS